MTQKDEVINIPNISSPNLRCRHQLGSRKDFLNVCAPLYDASIAADWQAAKAILNQRPELVRFSINESFETPLHIAVSLKGSKQRTNFVQMLSTFMEPEDLLLRDKDGNTVLSSAAIAGNVQLARLVLKRNKALLDIRDSEGRTPLFLAAIYGKHDMVRFRYDMSWLRADHVWTPQYWAKILVECIKYDMFDVALNIVTDIKGFSKIFDGHDESNRSTCKSLLHILALKTEAFKKRKETLISKIVNRILSLKNLKVRPVDTCSDALKLLRYICGHILRMEKKNIDDILSSSQHRNTSRYSCAGDPCFDTLFVAAELGNTAFVVELFRGYRDLIMKRNEDNRTIIHTAVLHGHKGIYNLIHEIGGSMTNSILSPEKSGRDNMLHLFARRSRDRMIVRPMQIIHEYSWYKELETMLPSDCRQKKSFCGKTPYELFCKSSLEAWSKIQMWASYCLLVATLVLGISFAATCLVPGGFDQHNGYPILTNEPGFSVFALADTIAFLASVVSVLAFLSIVIFGSYHEQMLDLLGTTMFLGITTLLLL